MRWQALALAAGLAGLGVSIYLTVVHYSAIPVACPATAQVNCEQVLASPYGGIAGSAIPTSAAGVVWFELSALLAAGRAAGRVELARPQLVWAAWSGKDYGDRVNGGEDVVLGFVAPPLMLLGLSPQMVERIVRVPGVRAITEPVPAQVIAGLVMIGWHFPPLYDATLYSGSLHVVEHVMFIAAGVVLFWPMLAATSAQPRWQMSPAANLLYMLGASLPQDGVALALIFW